MPTIIDGNRNIRLISNTTTDKGLYPGEVVIFFRDGATPLLYTWDSVTEAWITLTTNFSDSYFPGSVELNQLSVMGPFATSGGNSVGDAVTGRANIDLIHVNREITFDTMTVNVATLEAGKIASVGIYNATKAGSDLTLQVQGNFATDSTGVVSDTVEETTLTPGFYYACYNVNGTTAKLSGYTPNTTIVVALNSMAGAISGYPVNQSIGNHLGGSLPTSVLGANRTNFTGGRYYCILSLASVFA